MAMPEFDRALCRKAAAECIELARITTDPRTKQTLLTRSQEWLKLAYAEGDGELTRLLNDFNTQQMDSSPIRRELTQQQPMQQQQAKLEPEDNV